MGHGIHEGRVALARRMPGWHGLGYVKQGEEEMWSLDELMVPHLLGFEVAKVPSGAWMNGQFYPSLTNYDVGNNSKINKPYMEVLRLDTMQPLGRVTNDYKILQNREVGEFVKSITGDEDAEFETAGVLDYGRRIWFLCRLKKSIYVAGDEIAPYFLITSSHDGTGRLRITICHERVVCANTLAIALGEGGMSWGTRHIGDVEARLGEAHRSLGLVKKYQQSFVEFAEQLLSKKMTAQKTTKFIEEVLEPMPKDASYKKEDAVEKARAIIYKCLEAPDIANFKDTAWGIFNAVTDADQHEREIRGWDKDPRGAHERYWTTTFEGPMVDRRNMVAKYLLSV